MSDDIIGIFYDGTCHYQLTPGQQKDAGLIPDKKLTKGITLCGVTLDIYPSHMLVHNGNAPMMKHGSRGTSVILLENNGVISPRQLRKGQVLTCNRGVWSILERPAFNALAVPAAA